MSWHLITCEYPPDVGGISDHTAQLASGLAAAGDEVHVYCPGPARPASGAVHVHAGARRVFVRGPAARRSSRSTRARARGAWSSSGCRTASGSGRSTSGFCLWVARRARAGDLVDVVVHEPYLEFGWGPLRHLAMAAVHRLMTAVLLRAADRVWISTPAWESRLRPYALGRAIEMRWLPVPGCETTVSGASGSQADCRDPGPAAGRPFRHLRRGRRDAARGTAGAG